MMKRWVGLLGVLMLLGLPAPGYASSTLLAHWTFDEGSGTIAHDSGPYHYDGTLSATGASFVSGGISGGAISLDAANGGLVNMGLVLNNLASSPYTISAWVKTSIVGEANQMVVASHKSTVHAGYILGVNTSAAGQYGQPGKAWFYNSDPGVVTPYSSITVVDDQWHQLVGVRGGGIVSLYVDGVFQASYADQGLPNAPAGTPLLFGGCLGPDGTTLLPLYSGLIDDVQMYGSALNARDIQFLFQNPGRILSAPLPGTELLLLSD
jgi:large repetitive protein